MQLTYEEAVAELQQIVSQLQTQGAGTSVEQLTENASRAVELINFCKNKLRHTETQIQYLFDENLVDNQE